MTLRPECCEKLSVPRIKVEERGRKATFKNEKNLEHVRIKVDGCVIESGKAADWVVSRPAVGDVIIELKGRDVEHATKQVEVTALHWQQNLYRVGRIAGLIVSTQFPKFDSKVRKAQENFARQFKGPLHVVTKNYEFDLEMVLSFAGPLKKGS